MMPLTPLRKAGPRGIIYLHELECSGELFEATPESKIETKANAPIKRVSKAKIDTLPTGFRLTHEGAFFSSEDGESRPVCSPLEIIARTRDDKGHNWGLLVEFDDPDGAKKRWNIPARTMTAISEETS